MRRIVGIQLKGFIPTQPYREALETMLQIAKANRCNNWLFDVRSFEGAKPADIEWASTEYAQKSIREMSILVRDKRRTANLVPSNVFANFQTQQATRKMEARPAEIDVCMFEDEAQALRFLTNS